jgi:predicted PurR-regulated permease PerM
MIPTLLALVQFDSYRPFLLIGIGVSAIQMVIGNFVEPNLMGRSLNMSPLVVVLSLVIWTAIWGIPGAFLCVPLTSVFMIILSHFEATRWISLCLTRDGRLKNLPSL